MWDIINEGPLNLVRATISWFWLPRQIYAYRCTTQTYACRACSTGDMFQNLMCVRLCSNPMFTMCVRWQTHRYACETRSALDGNSGGNDRGGLIIIAQICVVHKFIGSSTTTCTYSASIVSRTPCACNDSIQLRVQFPWPNRDKICSTTVHAPEPKTSQFSFCTSTQP